MRESKTNGHTMVQQISTFEALYSSIGNTRVYLVDDLDTSYEAKYGAVHIKMAIVIRQVNQQA